MKTEMHALEDRLGDPSIPERRTRRDAGALQRPAGSLPAQRRLQHRAEDGDGPAAASASTPADFDRQTETFSGGWQMRLALAKLLLGQPNLLLLDEPTNHLDLEARNWLETYLNAYPHAVILVSHDRFFLDAVVTRIADLTLRTLTDYHTNYSGYLVEHHERIEALRKAKREQDEEVARVKMFIDRFRYQATKASQVQSRIKMLEKVVPIDVPPERATIHFHFPACAKSGRTVLELKHARKAYGDLIVLDDLEPAHRARRPDRARRTQRRRQVDADAPAVRRGGARFRRAHRRPQRRHAVFRAGRSDADGSGADRLRDARVGIAEPHGRRRSATSSAASSSPATTSTSGCGCCRAASGRGWRWRACCCGRRTRCCSTSRPITSISIRRKCCSTR